MKTIIELSRLKDVEQAEIARDNALNHLYHLEDVCDYDLEIGSIVNTLKNMEFKVRC